ncbi:MAG: phosphotransferase [Lentisphaerae bacterium]|nr:phosphotransferase [Lentisphaerota bacterium]
MRTTKKPDALLPRKAVILAAGYGTRMLPLSLDTPKSLMPLWDQPVLAHILAMLDRWGVTEVLINLHHQPEAICNYIRGRGQASPRVVLSFEPEILGTGGALQRAAWFLDTRPFWVVNADIAADIHPAPLLRAFRHGNTIAALWLHPERGPRTVEMIRGHIADFASSRPGTEGTYTFCGLQIVSPHILSYIPSQGFSSIVQAYQRAAAQAWRIAGVCVPHSYWADLGTPENYLEAHREILAAYRHDAPGKSLLSREGLRAMQAWRRRIRFQGFLSAGRNVTIGKNAHIDNAVIWDNARIATKAVVEQAIIGRACEVHGRVRRLAVHSAFSLAQPENAADISLAMALQFLRWSPAQTTVVPFEPRGSARLFARLDNGARRVILVRYSREREENALYTGHARFLKSIGLPVPTIIQDVPAKNFFIMEDLGDESLQQLSQAWPARRLTDFYENIIPLVARWHSVGGHAARRRRLVMVQPFSPDLYRWEREFFSRHFLQPQIHPARPQVSKILDELSAVAGQLLNRPQVLVHRDLQASNIMRVGSRAYFIDFQGMRLGPAAYDLAALLCDPYVELPSSAIGPLLKAYNHRVSRRHRVSEQLLWLAAIERLAQALGAFGRLSANPETAWFGDYIAPSVRMMRRALEQAGKCPQLLSVLRRYGDSCSRGPREARGKQVYHAKGVASRFPPRQIRTGGTTLLAWSAATKI